MTDESNFVCADCGAHVFVFGYCPPGATRCASCQWLADIADPIEREKLRKVIEDDGQAQAMEAQGDAKSAAKQVGAGRRRIDRS